MKFDHIVESFHRKVREKTGHKIWRDLIFRVPLCGGYKPKFLKA